MREIRIEKVVVNIGVGEGGEKLAKAETLLGKLTNQKPLRTYAKKTIKPWGIRKGQPIGCKVTLRGEKAIEFLKSALYAVDYKIKRKSICDGTFSIGIKEHIFLPGVKYDPKIGVFGMDVCVSLERPGFRIKRRKIGRRKIPKRHRITSDEVVKFLQEKFNVEVIEEE